MTSEAPFMNDASGVQRKAANSATSSGSIRRLIAGSVSMIFSITSSSEIPCILAWSAICFSTSGVLTYAGSTQLEVTPLGPPSRATVLDSPSRPCLAETYADLYGEALKPCTEEMLMTRPPLLVHPRQRLLE